VTTIFLTHPAVDRDRALALTSGLRSAGLTVLTAPAPAGDSGWWAGLLAAVQDADVLLYATPPAGGRLAGDAATGRLTMPGAVPSAGGSSRSKSPSELSPVVTALRDYAAGLGIATLAIHLFGAGEATAIDFRRPTADAAFLLVGAIAAVPGRPSVAGWQAPPESPFSRYFDLAGDVQAPTLPPGDQRPLVDRLRAAAADPAVRELAAVLRHRPDLDAETARHLDDTFPELAAAFSATAAPGTSGYAPTEPSAGTFRPPAGALTASDVRNIHFRKPPFGRRGYSEQDVDAFLDKVQKDLQARYTAGPEVRVQLTSLDVHEIAFTRAPRGKRGYDEEEVDTFLDEIERTLSRLDQALAEHGTTVTRS